MEKLYIILGILCGIYTIAAIIVRITPTEKDDKAFDEISSPFQKVLKILEKILLSSKKK